MLTLINSLVIEDRFKSGGGDPFIGRRLATLLRDAGFERVEVAPSYSPALSNVHALASFAKKRLGDAEFVARVVRRGWVTAEQSSDMARVVEAWEDSEESVGALAECMAIGWKK